MVRFRVREIAVSTDPMKIRVTEVWETMNDSQQQKRSELLRERQALREEIVELQQVIDRRMSGLDRITNRREDYEPDSVNRYGGFADWTENVATIADDIQDARHELLEKLARLDRVGEMLNSES